MGTGGITFDELRAKATAARRTVTVCVRGDLLEQIEQAAAAWRAAVDFDSNHNETATAPALFDALAALEAEAAAEEVLFVITSIGAKAWRALVEEHPPSDDDPDGWRWNLETFPPAALAACCVEPALTEPDANELADLLRDGEWQKLLRAVYDLNLAGDLIPKFGAATAATPSSEPSSTTAPPEESLAASS